MSLFIKWMESLAETIEINETCLRKVSPFSQCAKCIDSCSEGAIIIKNGKPVIDEDKCKLCTKCITECTIHAIEGKVPKREVIHDTMIGHGGIAPSRTELLYYYKRGVKKIALEEELTETWKLQLESTNEYLDAMGYEVFQLVKKKPQQTSAEFTRREFFRHLSKESKDLLTSLTPAKWRFNHKAFSLNIAFPEWNFYEVEMNQEKCNLCEICFKLCPENVFDRQEETLTLDLSKCNGCQLCQDVCQEKAIKVNEYIHPNKVKDYKVHSLICSKCKNKFISWEETDEFCVVCERKNSLGFM